MIILFDLWVLNPDENYSPEEKIMFNTIHEFVHDRIVFLYDEITKEEEERKKDSPCIMIELIRKRLSFNGYSPELTQKLKGCFNNNDWELLGKRFDDAYGFLN